MLARDGRSVLDHLVDSGALTPERRDMVQALADAAIQASGGDVVRVNESLDVAQALSNTLSRALPDQAAHRPTRPEGVEDVPVEPEGKYARLDELGRGGQSIVWRALDRFVGREVALKELTWPGAEKSSGSSRAAQAVSSAGAAHRLLDHPGIVAVHELAKRRTGRLHGPKLVGVGPSRRR